MGVRELDEPKLLAGIDLEVLAELALMRRGDREARKKLHVHVGLPGRVLCVLDDALAAEELGEARAVDRPTRAGAAAGAGDARAEGGVGRAGPLGIAKRRVRVREEQMSDGRRLCGL